MGEPYSEIDVSDAWMDSITPMLSPATVAVLQRGGPSVYSRLVVHGGGNVDARQFLQKLGPADALARPILDATAASAVMAGLWLWHDWLNESHTLSQSITSPLGSYWHAIMHRREGDFGNAKYWYARCERHPARAAMGNAVDRLPQDLRDLPQLKRITRQGWDSNALVDLAEEAADLEESDRTRQLAVELQRLEWRTLFSHSVQVATGNAM